jgi:hypothetical protein
VQYTSFMEKKRDHMSRRRLLGIALGGAAAAGIAAIGVREFMKESAPRDRDRLADPEPIDDITNAPKDLSFLEVRRTPRRYDMGEALVGKRFSSLLTLYTGIDGAVPRHVDIDFNAQLSDLWKMKLNRGKRTRPNGDFEPRMMAVAKQVFDRYRSDDRQLMDLASYRSEISSSLTAIKRDIDLSRMRRIRAFANLTDDHMRVMSFLESKVSPTSMLAYSVTELMPTRGGDAPAGIALYDFLLRNAGASFVDAIPAVYDNQVSFGPYQFTPHALIESGPVAHGASLMHRTLVKDGASRHIPRSVSNLRGTANHKAAYLFALFNLAHGVRQLEDRDAKRLASDTEWMDDEDVVEYIAAAHHLPTVSHRSLGAYAEAYVKRDGDIQHNYLKFIQTRSRLAGPYAEKSGTNYGLLKKRFG